MAEPNEFNNGDKYYGRICGNPAPHEKLEPLTYADINRESAAKYIEAGKKSLAFDVEDAGCQAQEDKDTVPSFQHELRALINKHCKENDSNTPDFLLAEYLINVLDAYSTLNNKRELWYGRKVF